MIKWEYRSEEADNDKLNKLGQEGWEAVNVVTDIQNDGYGNKFRVHWVLMKRPIAYPSVIPFGPPPAPYDPERCLMCGNYHGSGMPCPQMSPFSSAGGTTDG